MVEEIVAAGAHARVAAVGAKLGQEDADYIYKIRRFVRYSEIGSRAALGHTKRSLNHWLRAAWPAFEHSLALEFLGFAGSDAREGVAAFTEKRPARFA